MDRTDLGRARAHVLSERRRTGVAYAVAVTVALAAGIAARTLMDWQGAPWWAGLAVAELVAVALLLAVFEVLAERLALYDWDDVDAEDEVFPGSFHLVRAHLDRECGCEAGTPLGECLVWIDALAADGEIGGAL